MESQYLQYEKLWKVSMKDGKKMNVLCIVERNHERSVFVLDNFRNFKGIYLIVEYNMENEEEILIQGKGNYTKLQKGKLKTKKLFKTTIILDEQEPSVQSADRTKTVQV